MVDYIKELEKLGVSEEDITGDIKRWKPPVLRTDKDCLEFLEGYLAPDAGGCPDVETFLKAIEVVMKYKKITKYDLAKDTNISKQGIYNIFNRKNVPQFNNILEIMNKLGLTLEVKPITHKENKQRLTIKE